MPELLAASSLVVGDVIRVSGETLTVRKISSTSKELLLTMEDDSVVDVTPGTIMEVVDLVDMPEKKDRSQ